MHEIVTQKNVQAASIPGGDQNQQLQSTAALAVVDLQFVGESTLAIAHYVTGYVTKVEKSNMQELWQEVSSHNSVYSKLWSFGVRSLRSRECGLYEASDLLLGDHVCGKSKTVKWIDVSLPHNRKRRLMNHSKLVEMRERSEFH